MIVQDLVCGDVITQAGNSATVIGVSDHPWNERYALVVWKMEDGSWSFDALKWLQEVGRLTSFRDDNIERLKEVLNA